MLLFLKEMLQTPGIFDVRNVAQDLVRGREARHRGRDPGARPQQPQHRPQQQHREAGEHQKSHQHFDTIFSHIQNISQL